MKLDFRAGVVGVFVNSKKQLLVGERSDVAGAWQLPQGGIDPGESSIAAIYREMTEEVGSGDFKIITIATRLVTYRFPEVLASKVEAGAARKYAGQTQQWYLLEFNAGGGPNLAKADKEFRGFDWWDAIRVVNAVIDFKRDAYKDGLRQLGFAV